MVGLHAAFTCEADTIAAAAELAPSLGVGVHVHVGEDLVDADAVERLAGHTTDDWILVHCVHLPTDHGLSGTIVHNPRSNMNNAVGYAHPTRFANPVALGSDGIGASMLDEFRVAFARLRESDVTASPETAWAWLEAGWSLVPEARNDVVTWSYPEMDAWHLAYTTDVRPLSVVVDGERCWPTASPPGSTPTRSGPTPPRPPPDSSSACDLPTSTSPTPNPHNPRSVRWMWRLAATSERTERGRARR